jgi:hypothetical protein
MLVAAIASVTAWRQATAGAMFAQRQVGAYDEWLAAFRKAQVATARLLVVEEDGWIRATANTLAASTEPALAGAPDAERDAKANAENDRLNSLYAAFEGLMRFMSGIGTTDDLETVAKGIGTGLAADVPPAERARVLKLVSAHAALGSKGK